MKSSRKLWEIRTSVQKIKKILGVFFVPEKKNSFLPRILTSKYLFAYAAMVLAFKILIISILLVLPNTKIFSDIASSELLTLINQARQEKNLTPLTQNNKLTSAADLKANDMLTNDYFEHTSPAGVAPWYWFKTAGYNYIYAGENLAMDFFESKDVFDAWMASPSHRDNILDPNFNEIGIAIEKGEMGARQTTLAVLTFGTPTPSQIKINVAKQTPSVTPKISATPTPKISQSPAPLETSASPTPEPASPSPGALGEQIALNFVSNNASPTLAGLQNIQTQLPVSAKVLGAFTSHIDEINQSLYLYFLIFLIAALGVNIFVKIRIQRVWTIIATSLLIVLCALFIVI